VNLNNDEDLISSQETPGVIDMTSVSVCSFPGFKENAAEKCALLGKCLGNKLLQLGAKEILLEVRQSGAIKSVS